MENNMRLTLHIKKPSAFFWLRKIRGVDINKCCAECFIGEKESRMYHESKYNKEPLMIELEIKPSQRYVAYYLCGMSLGYGLRK
jgi:hypothetical protein